MGANLILIVEDDADTRESLLDVLETAGYQAVTAKDGEEATRMLENGTEPSLIILDLMMPSMNGWEFLLKRAREDQVKQVPVLILSALPNAEKIAQVHGCKSLRKPVELQPLLKIVDETLNPE